MSIYAQAVSSGMSSLELMTTGENAATIEAYNKEYTKAAQRASILSARQTVQQNIAAIRQDQITSNTMIQMRQNQAEAWAKVNAATAGVEGGSVDDVIYETEKNEAFALQSAQVKSDQQVANQLSVIGSQTSQVQSIQPDNDSTLGAILEGLSYFEQSDLDIAEAFSNG